MKTLSSSLSLSFSLSSNNNSNKGGTMIADLTPFLISNFSVKSIDLTERKNYVTLLGQVDDDGKYHLEGFSVEKQSYKSDIHKAKAFFKLYPEEMPEGLDLDSDEELLVLCYEQAMEEKNFSPDTGDHSFGVKLQTLTPKGFWRNEDEVSFEIDATIFDLEPVSQIPTRLNVVAFEELINLQWPGMKKNPITGDYVRTVSAISKAGKPYMKTSVHRFVLNLPVTTLLEDINGDLVGNSERKRYSFYEVKAVVDAGNGFGKAMEGVSMVSAKETINRRKVQEYLVNNEVTRSTTTTTWVDTDKTVEVTIKKARNCSYIDYDAYGQVVPTFICTEEDMQDKVVTYPIQKKVETVAKARVGSITFMKEAEDFAEYNHNLVDLAPSIKVIRAYQDISGDALLVQKEKALIQVGKAAGYLPLGTAYALSAWQERKFFIEEEERMERYARYIRINALARSNRIQAYYTDILEKNANLIPLVETINVSPMDQVAKYLKDNNIDVSLVLKVAKALSVINGIRPLNYKTFQELNRLHSIKRMTKAGKKTKKLSRVEMIIEQLNQVHTRDQWLTTLSAKRQLAHEILATATENLKHNKMHRKAGHEFEKLPVLEYPVYKVVKQIVEAA